MSLEGNAEATNEVKGRIYTIPTVDDTLTKEGYAADAKATGEKFTEVNERIDNIDPHDAANVDYDNTNSELEADKVQAAIDEIASLYARAKELENYLSKEAGLDATEDDVLTWKENIVHHAGNKPFKEYTGDGSATARTIATEGIGRAALVYCSTHCSLVTPKGAFVADLSAGTISWIGGEKIYFANGNLVSASNNAAFNASNVTYYCQVI